MVMPWKSSAIMVTFGLSWSLKFNSQNLNLTNRPWRLSNMGNFFSKILKRISILLQTFHCWNIFILWEIRKIFLSLLDLQDTKISMILLNPASWTINRKFYSRLTRYISFWSRIWRQEKTDDLAGTDWIKRLFNRN